MNTPIVCLTLCCAAVALRAQTSADYLVHHEFLPPSGSAYTNSGATGAVNDGTPSGSVTLAVSPLGVGVTLGGAAGDEILCGPSPVTASQARTVSVWARTTAGSGIVTPLTLGTNGFGSKWDMDIDASNGGVLELGVGAGRTTGQGPALNDGQWHMMTAVLPAGATNLGQVRLYVDGAFAYSNSGTRVINTGTGDVVVGRSANAPNTIQHFPGDVDDAAIWSEAMSDAQVRGLYEVALDPGLGYDAGDYELLLDVYRQNQAEATIGGRVWRRATGLAGPAGLRALPNGGYELVFDPASGAGVASPAASFSVSGTGCAGPAGVPTLSAPQLPVLGATLQVSIGNVAASTVPFLAAGAATIPALPISALGLTSDPSCLLTVSLDLVVGPLVTAGPTASFQLAVPASSALAGLQLHFQAALLDAATDDLSLSARGTATLGF